MTCGLSPRAFRAFLLSLLTASTAIAGGRLVEAARPEGPPGRGENRPRIFLRSEVDGSVVYMDEQVTLVVRLYTELPVRRLSPVDQGGLDGFWIEDIPVPRKLTGFKASFRGKQYTVYDLRRLALFPVRHGVLTVGSMSWEATVAESDIFFSAVKRVTLTSPEVDVHVKPLPEKGRPHGFSGAVGSFTIEASVEPPVVALGGAATLTVGLSGRGNLQTAGDPLLPVLSDFKVYASRSTGDSNVVDGVVMGRRSWEYVLVPRAPGRYEIPPVAFHFFDPWADGYRTARSEALGLLVQDGGSGRFEAAASRRDVKRREIERFPEDIHYIRLDLGETDGGRLHAPGPAAFTALLLLPVLVNAGVYLAVRSRERARADAGLARFKRAYGTARSKLRKASRSADARAPAAFFELVSDALRGYVADKFDLAKAGLTRASMEATLREAGLSAGEAARVVRLMDLCDGVRFAPRAVNGDGMKRFHKAAMGALRLMEGRIRPRSRRARPRGV